MRITGLVLLICLLAGLTLTSIPAEAEPCRFHPHGGAGLHYVPDSPTTASGGNAAGDRPILVEDETAAKHAPGALGGAAALAHACCHVVPAFVPTTDPDHMVRVPVNRSSPLREIPAAYSAATVDIFRPPASA